MRFGDEGGEGDCHLDLLSEEMSSHFHGLGKSLKLGPRVSHLEAHTAHTTHTHTHRNRKLKCSVQSSRRSVSKLSPKDPEY